MITVRSLTLLVIVLCWGVFTKGDFADYFNCSAIAECDKASMGKFSKSIDNSRCYFCDYQGRVCDCRHLPSRNSFTSPCRNLIDPVGNCYSTCPIGTFYVEGSYLCSSCALGCVECVGPDMKDCLVCTHFSFNGSCMDACPSEHYADTNRRCIKNYFYTGFIVDGTCQASCPIDRYPIQKALYSSCESCHPLCSKCSGPFVENCTHCSAVSSNGTCVASCPKSHPHIDDSSGKNICVENCPKYADGKICVDACNTWMHYHQYIYKRQCVDSCPAEAPIKHNRNCITKESCLKLKKKVLAWQCIDRCPLQLVSFNSSCVTRCPDEAPYLLPSRECIDQCAKVTYENNCLENCPGRLLTFNGTCGETCPPPFPFLLLGTKSCTNQCPSFHWNNTCQDRCPTGRFGYNGSCLTMCPEDAPFKDELLRICSSHPCPFSLNFNNSCVEQCPPSHLAIVNGRCEKKCPNSLPYMYNMTCSENCSQLIVEGTKKCVWTCPRDTYRASNTCRACDPRCDRCTGPGISQCVDCQFAANVNSKATFDCQYNCTHLFKYALNSSEMLLVFREPKTTLKRSPLYCFVSCDNVRSILESARIHVKGTSNFLSVNSSNQPRCVRSCPSGSPMQDGRFCLQRCPLSRPYFVGNTCLAHCPPGKGVLSVKHYQCLKCPGNQTYRDHQTCREHCPPERKLIDGTDCVSHCGEKILFNGTCVTNCPHMAPLIVDQQCISECPSKMVIEEINKFSDDRLTCKQTCKSSLHIVISRWNGMRRCSMRCSDEEPFEIGMVCNKTCSLFVYEYFSLLECKPSCPSDAPLYYEKNDLKYCTVRCPSRFGFLEGTACKTSCKSKMMLSYDPKIKLFRCVKSCKSYEWMAKNQDERLVCGKCPGHQYFYNGRCVPSCPMTSWLIETELIKGCTTTCPPEFYRTEENSTRRCVQTCKGIYKFIQNNTCIKQCPENALINIPATDGIRCSDKCPDYHKYVLGFYKNTSDISYDQWALGTCQKTCPYYANYSYKGVCRQACPSDTRLSKYHSLKGDSCISVYHMSAKALIICAVILLLQVVSTLIVGVRGRFKTDGLSFMCNKRIKCVCRILVLPLCIFPLSFIPQLIATKRKHKLPVNEIDAILSNWERDVEEESTSG